MTVIERGQSFLKEVSELNQDVASKYFQIQKDAIESFVEANRTRFAALRDIKSVSDFVESERAFYAAIGDNVTGSVQKQIDLVRHNFETSRDLFLTLVGQQPEQKSEPKAPKQKAA